MITRNRAFGDLGEEIAAKYLKSKGFLILGRNYLRPYGEIDLIASKSGVVHFIEVKSVSREMGKDVTQVTGDWNPAERIDERKLRRLERVIQSYIAEFKIELDWQIDAALVYLDEVNKRAKVEILESVR